MMHLDTHRVKPEFEHAASRVHGTYQVAVGSNAGYYLSSCITCDHDESTRSWLAARRYRHASLLPSCCEIVMHVAFHSVPVGLSVRKRRKDTTYPTFRSLRREKIEL